MNDDISQSITDMTNGLDTRMNELEGKIKFESLLKEASSLGIELPTGNKKGVNEMETDKEEQWGDEYLSEAEKKERAQQEVRKKIDDTKIDIFSQAIRHATGNMETDPSLRHVYESLNNGNLTEAGKELTEMQKRTARANAYADYGAGRISLEEAQKLGVKFV